MFSIFSNSKSRCGIIRDIRNRVSLVRNFLSNTSSNVIVVTKTPEEWRENHVIASFEEISLSKYDHIFLDIDVKELDFKHIVKIVKSSSFIWFFPSTNDILLEKKIIKYRTFEKGFLTDDEDILLEKPKMKFVLNIYFDECISTLSYDIPDIKICDDPNLIFNTFCYICFTRKTNIALLKCCRKSICKSCILKWYKTCPYCRYDSPLFVYKPLPISLNCDPKKWIVIGKDANRFSSSRFFETLDRRIFDEVDTEEIIIDAVTFKDDIWDFVENINCKIIHYII
jgi:hypothetical protein